MLHTTLNNCSLVLPSDEYQFWVYFTLIASSSLGDIAAAAAVLHSFVDTLVVRGVGWGVPLSACWGGVVINALQSSPYCARQCHRLQ